MLIERKEFRLGKIIFVWDWYEATKWLNFVAGASSVSGTFILFAVYFGHASNNMVGIILSAVLFGLFAVASKCAEIIEKDARFK